jgi:hypothetical protein
LVVVLSVAPCLLCCPPSKFVIPRHHAIIDTFAAGPPSPFAYRRQTLSCRSFTKHQLILPLPLMVVVAFSIHPAAYQPHHQAKNVSGFHLLDLF